MQYQITSDGEVIGVSRLEHCDASMGIVSGAFVPSAAYGRVPPVFRLYVAAGTNLEDLDTTILHSYFAARDALNLGVATEEVVPLPVAKVHVTDYSDEIGEYEVTVWTDDIGAVESCRGSA